VKRYIHFVILLILCTCLFIPKSVQSQDPFSNKGCVFCLQAVPKCKPNQKLIPQTCEKCAHCVDIEEKIEQEETTKNQCGPICCLEYEKCLVVDDPKDGVADFKCIPLYGSSGNINEECKCPDGYKWTGSNCISKTELEFCTSNFNPVCGCDGMTYSNSCVAMQNGIKIFTKGKCPELISCETNDDCPSGVCDDGTKYKKYSCIENKCRELFFEHDLCGLNETNCCSAKTRIRTAGIEKEILQIMIGDLVLTDNKKTVRVSKVKKEKSKKQKILKVKLNDATILEISPEHPTADGRKFKDLKPSDKLDGRLVVESQIVPYFYKYTYDILPDSKTGNYYANGVLVGSTLK